ncbi:MAG: putative acylesterase/phospholipase RssA [Pseudohongiellaceae bacterium]|jgi:predicted acylesterase/phospholipase RssA
MNDEVVTISSPFKHIAISLSGGGVRAVGYHLGTFDYLERVNLLPEVHTLSSVSGGSLIAIGYALSQKKGESFQEFYDNLCEFLPQINTFEELLKILKDPIPNVASGSNNLITALAAVYRQKYFEKYYGDPTFGIFWNDSPEIHLKELIFNATEFKTGVGFRFQVGLNGSLIGNSKVSLREDFAKDIRMSDIMAASSCIPGGMEPLMFPQDFHWPGDPEGILKAGAASNRTRCKEVVDFLEEQYSVSNIPLMDGGIYDNQGITSIILTQARMHRKLKEPLRESPVDDSIFTEADLEPQRPRSWARWLLNSMEQASDVENQKDMGEVDLFIVSDTPIHSDPMYSIPLRASDTAGHFKPNNWKLGTIDTLGWMATIVLIIGIALSISASFLVTPEELAGIFIDNFGLTNPPQALTNSLVVVYWLALLTQFMLVIGTVSIGFMLRRGVSRAVNKVVEVMPPMSKPVWSYAKSLTLGQLIDMFVSRASSMSALTAKIFMHRIRQLGYTLLYSHTHFEERVLDNNINDTLHAEHNSNVPDFLRDPSDEAERVVGIAAKMGTKLWVNKPENGDGRDDLESLIAAGHISTCFNIIEHLWEYHRDEDGKLKAEMIPLFEQAKKDWIHLNKDPYWLLDLRENAGKKRGDSFWRKSTVVK